MGMKVPECLNIIKLLVVLFAFLSVEAPETKIKGSPF